MAAERCAAAERRHDGGQPGVLGAGAVGGRGGDDDEPGLPGQLGERVVALGVLRGAGARELDGHAVRAEEPDERGERRPAGGEIGVPDRTAAVEGAPDPPVPTPREDVPVAARRLGELADLVAGLPLGAATEVGVADRAREPPVALLAAGQHEQVFAAGQAELGAEDGGQAELGGRLGEADHPVHAVVVGEREGGQAELGGGLRHRLR